MKKVSFLLFALLFMASCKAPVVPEFHDNPVISHRGAWKETGHPQNSLASFKAAAELGCHGSECDVWTINTEESMDFFLANDFNYITTDYPTLLLQKCSK